MASTYNPRDRLGSSTGTSGAEVSDLRPEQAYDTDLRRVEEDERRSAESVNSNQDRVAKYLKAAKTAGAYKQRSSIAEPTVNGKTPRARAVVGGSEIPTMGDSGGRSGSTSYARKPKSNFGRAFG
jgi:hypothetical protein